MLRPGDKPLSETMLIDFSDEYMRGFGETLMLNKIDITWHTELSSAFSWMKIVVLIPLSLWKLPLRVHVTYIANGSYGSVTTNRRKSIPWTKDDLIQCPIYASLYLIELIYKTVTLVYLKWDIVDPDWKKLYPNEWTNRVHFCVCAKSMRGDVTM